MLLFVMVQSMYTDAD